jgi:vanillate O-demethylase monooxygenase subunit
VVERAPLVWVWGGELATADESLIPPTPELVNPVFRFIRVTVDVAAHFLLLHENVMDQTHFAHLHGDFAAGSDWDRGSIDLDVVDGRVVRTHTTPGAPAPPVARYAGIEPGTIVSSVSVGTFVQPGLNTSTTTHRVHDSGFTGVLQTFHVLLPQTLSSTRYTIAVGTTDATADLERLRAGVHKATLEDQQMVEAIQAVKDVRRPSHEVSVRADQPGLQARRLVQARLMAEAESAALLD